MARPVYVVHCVDTEGPRHGVTTVVNVDPATAAASRRVLNDPSAAVSANGRS